MRVRLSLCAALLAAPVALAAANPRPITETDLFRFVWVADPQISPDGKRVAFVRVAVNKKKDGYDTAVWVVPADGSDSPRAFTSGPQDAYPRWSPDGKWIAFTRTMEKDGKPQPPQLYVIPSGGGEARALTDLPKGAGSPEWSPDGATIAFLSNTNEKDLAKKAKQDAAPKKDENGQADLARESDVRVITRAVYRFNGRGYLDRERPGHVWTVAALGEGPALPVPKQVTTGEFDEDGIAWSPDGAEIFFTSNREKEPYYLAPDTDLYAVRVEGGLGGVQRPPAQRASEGFTPERAEAPRRIVDMDGPIGEFAFSPDGRRIALRGILNGTPARSYDQPDLFVVDRAPGAKPRNLTADYDYDVGSGLTGDQRA
ncbi:MAG TPA: S9 family peptidase, partial [Vicinamibacteria bacterium]|nr:S9 family peptidase [Vicinamibacteria bacterium]